MSIPAHQSKSDELVDRLNELGPSADEFSLRLIERDAKKLMPVDAKSGHMILGMVHSIRGNLEGCRQEFAIARGISGEIVIEVNHAQALFKLFAFDEAYDVALKNFLDCPGDIEVIAQAIDLALFSGMVGHVDEMVGAIQRLNCNDDGALKSVAIAKHISDKMGPYYPAACTAFSEYMMGIGASWRIRVSEMIEGGQAVLSFYLQEPPRRIAEINAQLADVISSVDPYVGEHLIFMCRPFQK